VATTADDERPRRYPVTLERATHDVSSASGSRERLPENFTLETAQRSQSRVCPGRVTRLPACNHRAPRARSGRPRWSPVENPPRSCRDRRVRHSPKTRRCGNGRKTNHKPGFMATSRHPRDRSRYRPVFGSPCCRANVPKQDPHHPSSSHRGTRSHMNSGALHRRGYSTSKHPCGTNSRRAEDWSCAALIAKTG